MKPHRIRMTHSLIMNYGLYKKMEIYVRIAPLQPLLLVVSLTHPSLPPASEACHETGNVPIPHRRIR